MQQRYSAADPESALGYDTPEAQSHGERIRSLRFFKALTKKKREKRQPGILVGTVSITRQVSSYPRVYELNRQGSVPFHPGRRHELPTATSIVIYVRQPAAENAPIPSKALLRFVVARGLWGCLLDVLLNQLVGIDISKQRFITLRSLEIPQRARGARLVVLWTRLPAH